MIYPTGRLVGLVLLPAGLSLLASMARWAEPFAAAAWLLAGALAITDAWPLVRNRPPELQRQLPLRPRVGVPCEFGYVVRGASPGCQLSVLDELPEDLGGDHWLSWRASAQAPVTPSRGATASEPRRSQRVTPTRRGLRPLGPTHLFWRSPLGLWTRRHAEQPTAELPVLPQDTLPRRSRSLSRLTRRGLGLRPHRPRGEGTEFDSLRDYGFDDEPRKIDWRASARRQHLVVRNYHVEQNHTLLIAVDCGLRMGTLAQGQSKLDHALSATMSLVRASSSENDRVGFAAFDRRLRAWVSPRPARQAIGPITQAMLPLAARSEEASYPSLSRALLQRQKKRVLLVVLTDLVEGAASTELTAQVAALARQHRVLLVGIRDPLLGQLNRAAPELQELDVYRRLVLQDVEVARQTALRSLSRAGVHTLDLEPSAITAPLLDRYLAIRAAGLT